MKNSSIVSAIIGGAFFAIPYLGLSIGALPSLAIGACAYGAGELILRSQNKEGLKETNRSLYETLKDAKEKNLRIANMIPRIEDAEIKKNIKEINESIEKIVYTIERNPNKLKKMNNFFDYYLPVTLNILEKYDEIENQRLSSSESKKFMEQTRDMVSKINNAFKSQLAGLYQADMVDTDAEMKVFESMLNADGYGLNGDFSNIENKEEKQGEE